ncbi:fumarylacetoacetate hydrolase family protein [Thalassotalea aquiviva]|uniref:fumarylacetoacetate hydrolase family protein n=1 Tax=Thalassotalea aquiviva TaxID=3242415 RepID=UPI00352AAA7A
MQVGKIICIGRNYRQHIEELGNELPDDMVVFFKPPSSMTETLTAYADEPLHYEAELCFKIMDQKISAVAVGLDLTKRALQSKLKAQGLPWERAKAFDGSILLSEFVALDKVDKDLTVTLTINGQLRQHGQVKQMIYQPEQIIEELQSFIRLEDGDIIMTGTPKGVGKINLGDVFFASVRLNETELVSKTWQAQ